MSDRNFPPTLIEMKKIAHESNRFRTEEVPPRHRDKQRLQHVYRELQVSLWKILFKPLIFYPQNVQQKVTIAFCLIRGIPLVDINLTSERQRSLVGKKIVSLLSISHLIYYATVDEHSYSIIGLNYLRGLFSWNCGRFIFLATAFSLIVSSGRKCNLDFFHEFR